MSIDNSELLMLLGGKKKAEQTIGIAGQQGFGVGVYGGDPADLRAMGLKPMSGCFNPTSNDYGNYIHTNGSVMVFIPAFAIRIGNASAPLYSKYGADTIEIGDVELNGKDGWAIPRGFYDGGKLHQGFFVDKYLCSKDPTGTLAVSVDVGDPISLAVGFDARVGGRAPEKIPNEPSSTMPNCYGKVSDAITLSRARGEHYALVSCYQWAVISIVTQAHAQAATSVESCAWYDAAGVTNYPKGNNADTTSLYKDVDDKSILFNTTTYSLAYSKAGAGIPVEKTTHNGQKSGITDVNGNKWQSVLGLLNPTSTTFKAAKLSVKMHDFTEDNRRDNTLFDQYRAYGFSSGEWHYWKSPALYATDDPGFPLCGVIPKTPTTSSTGTVGFGTDGFYMDNKEDSVLLVAGHYKDVSNAGVWSRYTCGWTSSDVSYGFRAAGYPP